MDSKFINLIFVVFYFYLIIFLFLFIPCGTSMIAFMMNIGHYKIFIEEVMILQTSYRILVDYLCLFLYEIQSCTINIIYRTHGTFDHFIFYF